jgi:hypothetical protein
MRGDLALYCDSCAGLAIDWVGPPSLPNRPDVSDVTDVTYVLNVVEMCQFDQIVL